MPAERLSALLPYVAIACGMAGVAGVVFRVPKRLSPLWLGLLTAFLLLATGGTAAVVDHPLAARLSGVLFLGGLGAVALTSVFVAWHAAGLLRVATHHRAETERAQRALQQASGTNIRLEDELLDLRVRLARLDESGDGGGSVQRLQDQLQAIERREAEMQRHRAVFEQAIEGMARLERETLRLADVNDALVRMAGRPREDLETMTLLELFSAERVPVGKRDLQRAARERRPIAVTIERVDGTAPPAELTLSVLGDGSELELLAVLRDVGHRESAEREVERQVELVREREKRLQETHRETTERLRHLEGQCLRLQQTLEAKDHFIGALAHELRTPLTSIYSFSEILLEPVETPEKTRREFLQIVQKEAGRLSRLVGNVLDLSRIENGEMDLAFSEFDAGALIDDAADVVRGEAILRGVEVASRRPAEPTMVFADRDRLQQVLVNLIGNAVKFSPDGAEVTVAIEPAGLAGHVRIAVRDQGEGISEDEVERIFDRYFRGGSARSGSPGAGLGLTICREIAQAHGARVWAEATEGEGATFVFEMPDAVRARSQLTSRRGGTGPIVEVKTPRPVPPLQLLGRYQTSDSTTGSRRLAEDGELPPLTG